MPHGLTHEYSSDPYDKITSTKAHNLHHTDLNQGRTS